MVRTYRLYASITATGNALAQLDIKRPGKIVGVDWTVTTGSAPATGDYLRAEVSFASTVQTTTNDASGVISEVGFGGALTTSGGGYWNGNVHQGPTAIRVQVGDRLYLNATENGSTTWVTGCVIHVDE